MTAGVKAAQGGAALRTAFLLQLLGAALPALVMLLSVPLIREQLDLPHFAAFTVLLSAVGLLAVLDGGLGRAATYFMSLAGKSRNEGRTVAVFQGVLLVGGVFSVLLALAGMVAVRQFNGAAAELARPALNILVGFAPAFVAGALLRGFLEARQRFAASSAMQVFYGTLLGVAPIGLFHFSDDLRLFAWMVGGVRILLVLAQMQACGWLRRCHWRLAPAAPIHARRVFDYAKWLFLSNLIGLAIVFADRVLVASLFPAAAVAAYLMPMEMVARLQILVNAFCAAVFPRLVAYRSTIDPGQLAHAQGVVMCGALCICSLLTLLAEPLMRWWLGPEIARTAAGVLTAGVVGSGLIAASALAMLVVNSRGLTRPVALLHLMEMPAYLALLYGAARSSSLGWLLAVWMSRLALDAAAMTRLAQRCTADQAGTPAAPFPWWPWILVLAGLGAISAISFSSLQAVPMPALQHGLAVATGLGTAALAARMFIKRLRISTGPAHQRIP